ncbi:hypothetical protein LPJ74_004179 [Coemansia sp. RSA 1843]|nr:hypothetical protein LPJ74_004179 [Coemansia sp. RSA 1843]
MCLIISSVVHKSDLGAVSGDNRRIPGGLRRSVSKRLLGKPNNSLGGNSKSIADLRGSAERQQQFQQSFQSGRRAAHLLGNRPYGIEEEGVEEDATSSLDYLNSSNINGFTGLGQGSSFLAGDTNTSLLDRLQNANNKPQNIDMAGRGSLGKRSVKRATNIDEQSRYDKVGYPKSTRSIPTRENSYSEARNASGSQSRDTQKSTGASEDASRVVQKKRLQSKSHSRLKGFEMRVIDTHNGKAVVHAPILTKNAVGSDRDNGKGDNMPDLPPPSAAELRFNAQRALISTTSILRTTVKDKSCTQNKPDTQKSRNKLPDAADIAAVLRTGPSADHDKGSMARPLVRTASETLASSRSNTSSQRKAAAVRPRMELFLEQGRASTGSTLEQWGIVTSASLMQTKVGSARPEQGSLYEHDEGGDSDSGSEDAIRLVEDIARACTMPVESMIANGSPGPDNRSSSLVISDESRKLIESIFSGRLSIGTSGAVPVEQQRLSRYADHNRTSPRTNTSSVPKPSPPHTPGPDMAPTQQNNLPGYEQLNKSKQKLGSGNHQLHNEQEQAQDHSERDGSKMRKPSFWSIFRGSSQRKEQSDDKKDASSTDTLATQQPRQHFLRKQQSSSSGFAENFGFTRLLSHNDNKGVASAPGSPFTNKALPSVPPLSQPHPLSHNQQRNSSMAPDAQTMTAEDAIVPNGTATQSNSTCVAKGSQTHVTSDANANSELDSTRSYDDTRSGANPSVGSIASPTDGTHETGGYYTPSQEFFSMSSSVGDRRDEQTSKDGAEETATSTDSADAKAADRPHDPELIQGPDSQSGCTPADSPVVIASTLRTDSAATDGGKAAANATSTASAIIDECSADDAVNNSNKVQADDDSDIVPLSQSRALIEAQARDVVSAKAASRPSTNGDASAVPDSEPKAALADGKAVAGSSAAATEEGLGISTSTAASDSSKAAKPKTRPLPHPIDTSTPYNPSLELEGLPSTARLRFSPDNTAKELDPESLHNRSIQKELSQESASLDQQITPAPSAATADASDEPNSDAAQAAAVKAQEESSAQARAMGKYLFDIEEFNCKYYGNQAAGRKTANDTPLEEPQKPALLEGMDIPHLVDHAEWLGKRQIFNGLVLRYYIANYDFVGMRIDECLRRLCSQIYLRGESQVIDRLLVALSQRYVECNPDTTLKTSDVAHAVTYSTLLLNTDLHIADIRPSDRMTKSRFVRNTIDTIAQFQSTPAATAAANTANSQPASISRTQTDNSEMSSMPPQLPELDLSKMSAESSRVPSSSQFNGAGTPQSTASRFLGGGDKQEPSTPQPNEGSSGLRSLVGSMTSLNIGHSNTTASRSSRDVVRLMGGRGKRFSFFESSSSSSSTNANGNNSGSGAGISSGSQTPSIGIASGIQNNSSVTQGISSPSSLRAFDRLRRKVSTSGAHSRSRSGTVSMDESPLGLNNRPSISGSSLHSHNRDFDGLAGMASTGRSAGNGAPSDVARPSTNMPNLTELSSVLKDVYSGIKSKPLGQPSFARQATLLLQQQQQQQNGAALHGSHYSMSHGLAHGSHDPLHADNARTSVAFGSTGKHSLEVDVSMHGYGRHHLMAGQGPHTAYVEYDSQSIQGGSASGRPSSVRSMPLHSVQHSRSITSINQTNALNTAAQVMNRRPPQHPDPRVAAIGAEAMKRSGSSMIHFGGHNNGGTMRSSPSSASMGMGYMPSTAYTAYIRSPLENQHIRSGVLVRKHLFERAGKKASHRAWRTCYVSVDRGTVAMYKMDGRHGGHPDGRELTDTSLQLGSVSLRHTMTHMLPSPGYSRSRPHVFALQLPSGGVYLFQTASEVELRDWVAACNYWAARESKAPYMIGGVYNMEYGWDNTGDYLLRYDERDAREERGEELSAAEQAAEERRVVEERDASKGASILEWTPPNNPMLRSDLDEQGQLKALLHHITYLEEELVSHKKVQGSIVERFYPKTSQHQKAFSNWERKAQYILQELIKYQSYADVLQTALRQMQEEVIMPIPEEHSADGSTATTINGGAMHSANGAMMTPHCDEIDDDAFGGGAGHMVPGMRAATSQQHGANGSGAGNSGGLSGSRTSLPRKSTDPNGNPLPSKSLPIRELLAPASDKARNRTSIIVPPVSTSSTTTAGSGGAAGDKRRVSQARVSSASTSAINNNTSASGAANNNAATQASMPHLRHTEAIADSS